MNQEQYLSERLDDQIDWYDHKSGQNQRRYKICKVVEVILSASIPVLSGFVAKGGADFLVPVIAIIGALITVTAVLLSLNKYFDNWKLYRATAEKLQREKIMFLTKAGAYKDDTTAFKTLVAKAELLMAGENEEWAKLIKEEAG